jgi:hypothetical protein
MQPPVATLLDSLGARESVQPAGSRRASQCD